MSTEWRVYAKPQKPPYRPGQWITVGDPCSEQDARDKVVELQRIVIDFTKKKLVHPLDSSAPLMVEAHCVPV